MFKSKEKKREVIIERFVDSDITRNARKNHCAALSNENAREEFGVHFIPCEYVGSFAVMYAGKGMKTIQTHKERVKFVKERLAGHKHTKKTVPIVVMITLEGIKVLSKDRKKVKMAHALLRVSFSTCDPVKKLFAIMTHSPTPQDVNVFCHVFVTKTSNEALELNGLIGKAFQTTFVSTLKRKKGQKEDSKEEEEEEDIKDEETPQIPAKASPPTQPKIESEAKSEDSAQEKQETEAKPEAAAGKRWAKHEVMRGHEKGVHALMAKQKKEKAKKNKKSNGYDLPSETTSVPAGKKNEVKVEGHAEKPAANQKRAQSPKVRRKEAEVSPKEKRKDIVTASPKQQRRQQVSPEQPRRDIAAESPNGAANRSRGYSANQSSDVASGLVDKVTIATGIDHHRTPPAQRRNDGRQDEADSKPRSDSAPPLPPRNKKSPQGSPVINRWSTPATSAQEVQPPQTDLLGTPQLPRKTKEPTEGVDESCTGEESYQHKSWFLPNISREVVATLLGNSEEGTFCVRESHSQPGCLVLTVRVPYHANSSGIGNYLIVRQQLGIMIKGFDNVFPDLPTLIHYHSEQADGLPCRIALTKSNPFVDSDDDDDVNPYENFEEPEDPDYIQLSDFHSILEELPTDR